VPLHDTWASTPPCTSRSSAMSHWYRQSEEPPSPEHLDYLPRYQ
jgi:hypothetical protein